MHISWTKSAATMFTSYMAISNISSTMGNKFSGYIKELISLDMSFILLRIVALVPLIFLIWMNPDSISRGKGQDLSLEA